MKIRRVLAALFVVIAASAPATAPTYVTPADLVEYRSQFDGQAVTVGGILFREGERLCILDLRASLDGGLPRARIAIAPGHDFRFSIDIPKGEPIRPNHDAREVWNLPGRFVMVEGVFRAGRAVPTAPDPNECSSWTIEPTSIRMPLPNRI